MTKRHQIVDEDPELLLVAHCPTCGPFAEITVRALSIGTSIVCDCGFAFRVSTAAYSRLVDTDAPRRARKASAVPR